MKVLKYLLATAIFFSAPHLAPAQLIADPTTWKTEVKKVTATQYQLIFHLALKAGWHVYARTKGMDESLIVPSITVDNVNGVKVEGETTAKGILLSKNIEGIGPVSMYSDKVIYTQNITAKRGATVTGSYTYQTCNDNTCLPPTTKKFSVMIK